MTWHYPGRPLWSLMMNTTNPRKNQNFVESVAYLSLWILNPEMTSWACFDYIHSSVLPWGTESWGGSIWNEASSWSGCDRRSSDSYKLAVGLVVARWSREARVSECPVRIPSRMGRNPTCCRSTPWRKVPSTVIVQFLWTGSWTGTCCRRDSSVWRTVCWECCLVSPTCLVGRIVLVAS